MQEIYADSDEQESPPAGKRKRRAAHSMRDPYRGFFASNEVRGEGGVPVK